jgi:26S proteasome regulatory subunit N12
VSQDDHDAVERACTQLKTYYADKYCVTRMKRSERQNLITGLNLTRLLVQNRIAEFHTELELIPAETQADPRVKLPIELEQRLMEGSYDKILKQSKAALPSPEFGNFMKSLTATVKDEIAACMEKAYATLSAAAAAKMLGIGSGVEMNAFGESRGWVRSPDGLRFVFQKEKAPPSAKDIPSGTLIAQTMMYAKELERIV